MKRRLENTIEENLKNNIFWSKIICPDCREQNAFLAIRDNRIDLYHKGGKLFSYNKNKFKTHIKYASVITKSEEDKDYISESELSNHKLASNFEDNYSRIKENCSNYSGIEALGVSSIYHKHSYLSKNDDIVVLDIEVSFKSLSDEGKQDRIDILLFNRKTQALQFVEAKHYSNSEIW